MKKPLPAEHHRVYGQLHDPGIEVEGGVIDLGAGRGNELVYEGLLDKGESL